MIPIPSETTLNRSKNCFSLRCFKRKTQQEQYIEKLIESSRQKHDSSQTNIELFQSIRNLGKWELGMKLKKDISFDSNLAFRREDYRSGLSMNQRSKEPSINMSLLDSIMRKRVNDIASSGPETEGRLRNPTRQKNLKITNQESDTDLKKHLITSVVKAQVIRRAKEGRTAYNVKELVQDGVQRLIANFKDLKDSILPMNVNHRQIESDLVDRLRENKASFRRFVQPAESPASQGGQHSQRSPLLPKTHNMKKFLGPIKEINSRDKEQFRFKERQARPYNLMGHGLERINESQPEEARVFKTLDQVSELRKALVNVDFELVSKKKQISLLNSDRELYKDVVDQLKSQIEELSNDRSKEVTKGLSLLDRKARLLVGKSNMNEFVRLNSKEATTMHNDYIKTRLSDELHTAEEKYKGLEKEWETVQHGLLTIKNGRLQLKNQIVEKLLELLRQPMAPKSAYQTQWNELLRVAAYGPQVRLQSLRAGLGTITAFCGQTPCRGG